VTGPTTPAAGPLALAFEVAQLTEIDAARFRLGAELLWRDHRQLQGGNEVVTRAYWAKSEEHALLVTMVGHNAMGVALEPAAYRIRLGEMLHRLLHHFTGTPLCPTDVLPDQLGPHAALSPLQISWVRDLAQSGVPVDEAVTRFVRFYKGTTPAQLASFVRCYIGGVNRDEEAAANANGRPGPDDPDDPGPGLAPVIGTAR
jgi:hypothetical protein